MPSPVCMRYRNCEFLKVSFLFQLLYELYEIFIQWTGTAAATPIDWLIIAERSAWDLSFIWIRQDQSIHDLVRGYCLWAGRGLIVLDLYRHRTSVFAASFEGPPQLAVSYMTWKGHWGPIETDPLLRIKSRIKEEQLTCTCSLHCGVSFQSSL